MGKRKSYQIKRSKRQGGSHHFSKEIRTVTVLITKLFDNRIDLKPEQLDHKIGQLVGIIRNFNITSLSNKE